MSEPVIRNCVHCGAPHDMTGLPHGEGSHTLLCGGCKDPWEAAHPEALVGWIRVEDLTRAQRAELDAILGHHAGNG